MENFKLFRKHAYNLMCKVNKNTFLSLYNLYWILFKKSPTISVVLADLGYNLTFVNILAYSFFPSEWNKCSWAFFIHLILRHKNAMLCIWEKHKSNFIFWNLARKLKEHIIFYVWAKTCGLWVSEPDFT
jgi:hypothetical protein